MPLPKDLLKMASKHGAHGARHMPAAAPATMTALPPLPAELFAAVIDALPADLRVLHAAACVAKAWAAEAARRRSELRVLQHSECVEVSNGMIFSDSELPVKDQCFKHPSAMQVVIGPDEGTRHTGFLLMCEERQIRFCRCNGASSQVYKDVIPNWRGSSGPCGLAV